MERTFKVILKPLQRFAIQKPNASVLLFLATILAMILANSPLQDRYHHFLQFPVKLIFGDFSIFALMAVFFFTIGLEIKQEVLVGELQSFRKALLPIVAAIGGMVIPVLSYFLICHDGPEANGAAIPMATDIAFALAVLGLLGKRVPLTMRIFLTALAVVDDIGGIIIIALFYSGHVSLQPLLISALLLLVLYLGGKMKIYNQLFYYALGFCVWMLFMESGIHPTIAGVLVAFTVPAKPKIELERFTNDMTEYLSMLDSNDVKSCNRASVLTSHQIRVLNNIHMCTDHSISPLQAIAHRLHPWVNNLILPLFAFVNAGVTFGDIRPESLLHVPLAIVLGLIAGKSLGIFSFSYLFIRSGIIPKPQGFSKRTLFAVSMLGGIGFTVALFIANLSFDTTTDMGIDLLNQAKLGVFVGSFLSGLTGYLLLRLVLPKEK